MKQIIAFSKQEFDDNFSNEKFKHYNHAAFISILDVDNYEKIYDVSIDNFLQVKMWDIEIDVKDIKTGETYEKPSDFELKKIVDFVNKHKDKSVFIIHCSAGISRSGAVATYIKNKFNNEVVDKTFYQKNKFILPNLFILNRLTEIDSDNNK